MAEPNPWFPLPKIETRIVTTDEPTTDPYAPRKIYQWPPKAITPGGTDG